ncbi:hypothetical protein [Enterovirga sp. CN4-39]|uniref:hypothetical protein n=1 Tax=Enterovirga sp. CN4-39 TaxID=3400910 RepID=UPI003C0CE0B3
MSVKLNWWVTLAAEGGHVRPEQERFYTAAFSSHYHPAPYRVFSGPGDEQAFGPGDIPVLGDSTVASTGLCERLGDLASPAGGGRFLNFGITAANSGVSLARILHDIVDARPRAIVVLGGGSDILMPMSFDPRPGYPHVQFVYDLLFEGRFDPRTRSIWLKEEQPDGPALRQLFFDRLAALRRETGYGTPAWEAAILARFVGNVEKMARICSAWAVPLLFVMQPVGVLKRVRSRHEASMLPPPESEAYIARQYEAARDALSDSSVWTEGETAFLDLSDLFLNEEAEIFRDVIHPGERGMDLVARKIAARLRSAGWLG